MTGPDLFVKTSQTSFMIALFTMKVDSLVCWSSILETHFQCKWCYQFKKKSVLLTHFAKLFFLQKINIFEKSNNSDGTHSPQMMKVLNGIITEYRNVSRLLEKHWNSREEEHQQVSLAESHLKGRMTSNCSFWPIVTSNDLGGQNHIAYWLW